MLRAFLNSRAFLWPLLALPALLMLIGFARGSADAMDLLHPTGETSARLMIVAMCIGPLADLIGLRRWLRWLIERRRAIGVAAFAYAMLHLVFYAIDLGLVADMIAELDAPAIWTGWLALLAMAIPASISNPAAMYWLKRRWKRIQQIVYLAALLTLVHWLLIAWEPAPALVHFAPLIALNLLRLIKPKRKTA